MSLARRLDSVEREQAQAQEILERIDEGVLVFSESLSPVKVNEAARRMLGLRRDALPARPAPETILSVARRAAANQTMIEDVVSTWPGERRLHARAHPLGEQRGVLVVLKDITDELRMHRMRRQFVANASHELKSPVASLQALAEAINEAAGDDPAVTRRFATRLLAESERLGRLIADLLDLSRLEDPTSVATSRVDLAPVVEAVVEEMRQAAQAKKLRLDAAVSRDAWVRGDDQHLPLLVRNLLDNAIRYTPEGGTVSLELVREDREVVLRVSDNGIGIPLKAQARVFERFYRVDKDRSRERGGTGLGLSIVKHVAELHGGHVGVISELGEGSTFTTRLPALDGVDHQKPANPSARSSAAGEG